MEHLDVVASGYVSMDHIIKIASPARKGYTSLVTNRGNTGVYPGGCSLNIAYALCRLGLRAAPILRVGGDYRENGLKDFLEQGGVPEEGVTVVEEEATSTCYLLQDNNNEHITVFYPGSMDGKYAAPLPDTLFEQTRLAVMTVASRPDNEEFFRQCRRFGVPLAFGMKADFDAFPREFLKEILSYSSIIFTNEAEKAIVEELLGLANITGLFAQGRADIIVTTLGKEGSVCYERQDGGIRSSCLPAYRAEQVADATGTGDAYIAGFLYGYLNGRTAEECAKLGSALSWFVLQKEGCCTNIPTQEELNGKVRREEQ